MSNDTAEQLDLLPAAVAGLLQDTDLLHLRVADLEEKVEQQRRRAEAEKQRRIEAETSRDHWITIAKGNGVQLGQTSHLVDPQAAQRAAQREADYTRRLLQERDHDVISLRQLTETLAHFARLVPKLPCSIKALPHDVTMALYWAVVVEGRHYEVLADWSGTDRATLAATAKGLGMATWEAGEQAEEADVTAYCDQPLPEWPHAEPPTADLLARFHLVHADLLRRDHNDLVEAGALDKGADPALLHAYFDKSTAFLAEWAVTYLLRALQEHAPDVADAVAGELWESVESGDTPHECTYDWLVEYRIDPAKVAARHAEYKAQRAERAGWKPGAVEVRSA